jgi:two-component sensor histidine kinase
MGNLTIIVKKNSLEVFLQYSWDSEPHKEWVLELANRLTSDGVDLCFDRYDLQVGSNHHHFMEKIETCNKVIFIMSTGYKTKADNRSGGIGYEYQIMTSQIASELITNKKFIPVLRNGDAATSIPMLLRSFVYHDMRDDKLFEQKYLELLHLVFDEPIVKKPKLGKKPNLGNWLTTDTKPVEDDQLKTSKKVHDIVANSLYRVMMEIEGDGEVDRQTILDKLESIYEKSRDISYDRSDFVEPEFHETIDKLLSSSADNMVKIDLLGNSEKIWVDIDKHKQYQIKTIVQEIMDNMKNHSHATHVFWKFERLHDQIEISYNDNGVGMKQNQDQVGRNHREKGLTIISTLLNSMGGVIEFRNAESNGLTIKISFPAKVNSTDHLHRQSNIVSASLNRHDFTSYDLTLIKLLSQGVAQKDLSKILESKNMRPSALSSIEKRLNIIKLAYNLSGNAQLIALCKDMGLI